MTSKIPKYMQAVEDWNKGLSQEYILEKYSIAKSNLQNYLYEARKKGIKVNKRATKYMQIAEDWNRGLSPEKIIKKYRIKKSSLHSYLNKARKNGIKIKKRVFTYIQVAKDWNRGLSQEYILRKYKIKKTTLQVYLSKARKYGIQVPLDRNKVKDKSRPKRIFIKKTSNIKNQVKTNKSNNIEKENKKISEITKKDRNKIIDLLKTFLPRQVAKRLKISCKTVFDVIDSLNEDEKKEVDKAFVRNRQYVFRELKKCKNKGYSPIDSLAIIDEKIPVCFISQLEDVYYNLGLYANIEKSINKRIYIDESTSDKDKKYLHDLKETMHLEVISMKIRKQWKEAIEKGKTISFERLCKEYNVRTSFLIDLLGREERDY